MDNTRYDMEEQNLDLYKLRKAIEAEGYIFDEDFLITVYIALKLGKPLLIEGEAGVGKTEVAKMLAAVYSTDLIRLQCFEGLDESKALYEWNYQKQLLHIQLQTNKNNNTSFSGLYGEEFLLERPLLKAIKSTKQSVLLIDEIDKADEEFEAFLLELLSDFQISIPELGTVKAKNIPVVVLTSNNTRQLSEALRRRCVYLYIDYPSIEKEMKIINSRIPNVPEKLVNDVVNKVSAFRKDERIIKKPSVAETLDWVSALLAIGRDRLDRNSIEATLGFVLKNREDIEMLKKDDESS